MALKYGFYDSVNGDRPYSGHDFTRILNNLIMDGVLPQTVGRNQFGAKPASSGLGVIIDSGWAWFDSTYTTLTAPQTFPLDAADAVLYRWDAVVIETDPEARENTIRVIKGTPAAETAAAKPTLSANQHPLCYIRVTPGLTKLTQSNIENRVGLSDCPFITSIVQTADLTQMFAAWQYDFDEWFAALQENLSGDVAGNLQRQITANADAISGLSDAISGKADSETLDELIANVGSGGNNCRIQCGSYIGDGTYGSSNPTSLSFDFFVVYLVVMSSAGNYNSMSMMRPFDTSRGASGYITINWTDSGVSWYSNDASDQSNTNGKTYRYVAIGYTPEG